MSDYFLFEHEYRNRLWRFQPMVRDGTLRLHVWAWFRASDGEWRPCKGNEVGFVIPQERFGELAGELTAFAAQNGPRRALSAV